MVLPWFSSQASQDPLRPNPSSKEGPAAAQQAAPALRAKCRSSGTLAAASAACVRQIWMGDGHIIGILTKGSTINDHPIYGTLLVYPTIDDGSNGHGKIGKNWQSMDFWARKKIKQSHLTMESHRNEDMSRCHFPNELLLVQFLGMTGFHSSEV